MTAQASTSSSDLSALFSFTAAVGKTVKVSAKAGKLEILCRVATASTVLTCACYAALTILG